MLRDTQHVSGTAEAGSVALVLPVDLWSLRQIYTYTHEVLGVRHG